MLARLPELVVQRIEDLQTLLPAQQVDNGKDVLAALIEEIRMRPVQDNGKPHLEVELMGDIQRFLRVLVSRPRGRV